jgi:hypothetical protein
MGGDFSEVDPAKMAALLGGFEWLGKELGCFVMVIAHENKAGGMMGSIGLKRPKEDVHRSAQCRTAASLDRSLVQRATFL